MRRWNVSYLQGSPWYVGACVLVFHFGWNPVELCQHYYKPGGSGIMLRNVSCLSKPLKRLQEKIPTGIRLAKISHSSFTTNYWVSPNLFFFSLRIPNVMVLRTSCVFIYYNATTTIPVISCWNTSGKHNINLFVSWIQALIPGDSLPFNSLNVGFTRLLGHKRLLNQHWNEREGKALKRFSNYDRDCSY